MSMKRNPEQKKIYDLNEAREKIRAYCAYRERSQAEVRQKLEDYGLITEVVDELIMELIQENFLNEERFARAFVRGKFHIKKWGRVKIRHALYHHGLSKYILTKAFEEINEEAYSDTLREVIEKKMRETRIKNDYQRNGKVAAYVIGRGYEPEMVWEIIKG